MTDHADRGGAPGDEKEKKKGRKNDTAEAAWDIGGSRDPGRKSNKCGFWTEGWTRIKVELKTSWNEAPPLGHSKLQLPCQVAVSLHRPVTSRSLGEQVQSDSSDTVSYSCVFEVLVPTTVSLLVSSWCVSGASDRYPVPYILYTSVKPTHKSYMIQIRLYVQAWMPVF